MEEEIMNNEEVFEEMAEVANKTSNKAFLVASGIGLAALAGTIVYRKVVKPFMAKRKAEKEANEGNTIVEDFEEDSES